MPNDPNPVRDSRQNPAPSTVPNVQPRPQVPEVPAAPQIDSRRIAEIEQELSKARKQIEESAAKIERALGHG